MANGHVQNFIHFWRNNEYIFNLILNNQNFSCITPKILKAMIENYIVFALKQIYKQ